MQGTGRRKKENCARNTGGGGGSGHLSAKYVGASVEEMKRRKRTGREG